MTGGSVTAKQVTGWCLLQQQILILEMIDSKLSLAFQTVALALPLGDGAAVAWLYEHEQWSPLVRIEDDLHYIVVTNRSAEDIFEIGDLVGRQLCTPLAPDLGNLLTIKRFPNRNRQPLVRESASGRKAHVR